MGFGLRASGFGRRQSDLPARFPSPFAEVPHPIARAAVLELARSISPQAEGKMFGALVVKAPDGALGYLAAFSGMLDGRWLVDGFAPPVFDADALEAFWPAGEATLAVLDRELAMLDAYLAPRRADHAATIARHAAELAAMRARHDTRRAARRVGPRTPEHDAESRADGGELRRLKARHAEELAAVAVDESARIALEARKAAMSRGYLVQIHETYRLANARGEVRTLREIFAPSEPPGGAGDCAAPKLLAEAYRRGLTPIALAEIWLGPPPLAGGRRDGELYPACRGKCAPILAHMLAGLDADPPPTYVDPHAADPRVVHEDAHLIVVDKPCGLLSVPGRGDALRDCVQARLRAAWPTATVVHRLDLDTSGLLLAAKDDATYAALQRAFALREIDKIYEAVVDADVAGTGTIDLALRLDVDDRPRQVHDPIHGKAALTEYRAIGSRRLELIPRTGRTHQLRVHCAHPLGLDAPIAGDRLYGTAGPRLHLHARALAFAHPHTGARIALTSRTPF